MLWLFGLAVYLPNVILAPWRTSFFLLDLGIYFQEGIRKSGCVCAWLWTLSFIWVFVVLRK